MNMALSHIIYWTGEHENKIEHGHITGTGQNKF